MAIIENADAAYTITPATANDVSQLEQLVNSAYRGEGSKQGWTTEADLLCGARVTEESLLKDLSHPGISIYLYRNANRELEGCVLLQNKAGKLYVGMLSVSPGLQNKGIGKILLQQAEQVAKQQGCIALTMTVITLRTSLIAWYQRHGYQQTGELIPFNIPGNEVLIDEPLHFVVLEKILSH